MSPPNYLAAYNGRRCDVLLISVADDQTGSAAQPASTAIYGRAGVTYRIAGIRKIAQRFLILLFTPLGGDPVFPGFGCIFLTNLLANAWRNASDVRRDFNSSLLDIIPQMRSLELATDPPDEQIKSASLDAVTITADLLAIQITFTAQSQGTNTLLVPLTTMNEG